eukprot:179486_1
MFHRPWLDLFPLLISSNVRAEPNTNEYHKAVIIGAGWAGIGVGAALSSNQVDDYVILEKGNRVGYFWSKLYDSIRMNTYRHRLWHSPSSIEPAKIQDYRDKEGVLDYLTKYTQYHNINPHIQLNKDVQHIEYDTNNNEWILHLSDGQQIRTSLLTVATSINRVPYIPEFQGMDQYSGCMLHAFEYERASQFDAIQPVTREGKRKKKFLVIGCGNSAIEIAGEIQQYDLHSNDVTLLVRNGRHFTKEKTKQRFESVLNKICSPSPFSEESLLKDNLVSCNDLSFHSDIIDFDWLTNFIMIDMSKYGIPKPTLSPTADHYYYKKLTIVDRGTIPLIKKGWIHVNNKTIKQFVENGVEFEDGSIEEFDVVIFGTGYRHGLDDLFGERMWSELGTKEFNYPDGLVQMYQAKNIEIPMRRAYDWPDLNGRGRSKIYDNLYFAGFDQGYLGGLTIGLYSYAIGEELCVKLDKLSVDQCTIPWIKDTLT